MPLTRASTTRNTSRSPAPPVLSHPSTPRAFLPPSHYAAAGGFNICSPSSKDGEDYATQKSRNSRKDINGQHRHNNPESSKSPGFPGPATASKRPSSRSGFPDIEPQLVPSLRDTIDRMTRVPGSGTSSVAYKPGTMTTTISQPSTRDRQRLPRPLNSPERKTRGTISDSKYSDNQMFASYYSPATIEESITTNVSQIYSNQNTPTTTTSTIKGPMKSALKSSLKAIATTTNSPQPSDITRSPSVAGSSLRTMRSLTRKCSATLKSPFSSNKSLHEKGRKNLGNVIPPMPILDHAQNDLESEGGRNFVAKKEHKSSIPRPRRYYHDDPQDSDLDRQYDTVQRNNRKLTVANAEVPASGSESDADPRRNTSFSYANIKPTKIKNQEGHIGLGLSLRNNSQEPRLNARNWKYSGVMLEDNQHPNQNSNPQREKNLRFSLPESDSSMSKYSQSVADSEQPSRMSPQSDYGSVEYDKRTSPPAETSRIHREGSMESDDQSYYGSRPQSHNKTRSSPMSSVSTQSMDQESESEREGYCFRKPKFKEKRRSSSCTPTISGLSDVETEDFVPIVPPRPRSACQRYEAEPSRESRVFPPDLRELIKSRHSFTKILPKDSSAPLHHKPISSQKTVDGMDTKTQRKQQINQTQVKNPHSTAASTIIEDYRSAAARERKAFGIPLSESDEFFNSSGDQNYNHSRSVSDELSIPNSLWQDGNDNGEVENMFGGFKAADQETPRQDWKDTMQERTPRFSVIAPSLSASSVQGRSSQTDSRQYSNPKTRINLDGNLATNNHIKSEERLRTREAVIQEIFETEEILLNHLHIWVPPNVARLLDWFDDIINLHEQIYQSLCCARDTMSPATDRVSESLRCFVLKGETYQPYLVRLADVSEEILRCVNDPNSDFGQFISIQQASPECEGWSLDRLLKLPVNRLTAYQEMFTELLDLTPKTHQDYLSTFSLSRSTDMLIKVMTEVKVREDEYNLLKKFSARIQGLPFADKLATRERRLLHSGPLSLVTSCLSDAAADASVSRNLDYQGINDRKRGDQSSKLLDAISTTSSMFDKSDSETSVSSSDSRAPPPAGLYSNSNSAKSSWLSRLPLRKRSKSKSPMPPTIEKIPELTVTVVQSVPQTTLQTVDVHAFVFSDMVLLAQPSLTSGRKSCWILFEDLGLFRPLSIARIDPKGQGIDETILSLEALDLSPESMNDNIDFRSASFRTIELLLPLTLSETSSSENDMNSSSALFQAWLSAFQKCMKTTLQQLTFIGHVHQQQDEQFIGSDKVLDTYLAVSSLVNSGLPIPRSPSGQIPSIYDKKEDHAFGDEREERGWWSLRFQQIFRQFQRQDSLVVEDE